MRGLWDIFKESQMDAESISSDTSEWDDFEMGKSFDANNLLKFSSKTEPSTTKRTTKRLLAPYIKAPRLHKKHHKPKPKHGEVKQESSIFRVTLESMDFDMTDHDLPQPVYTSAEILRKATGSCGVAIYLLDPDAEELILNRTHGIGVDVSEELRTWEIKQFTTVACHCAITKRFVWVDDLKSDSRFPQGVGWFNSNLSEVKYVLCAPVVTPEDEVIAIFELHRMSEKQNFSRKEVQLAVSMAAWVGAGIYQNQLRLGLLRQQNLNNKLLSYINRYFSEPTFLACDVFSEIMAYAKKILGGERAFVYVIDMPHNSKSVEYYCESLEDTDILLQKKANLLIDKLPGVIRHAIDCKTPLHINNIFDQPEFNDLERVPQGPYETCRSVLCAPILDNQNVIGVILLTNKKGNGYFTPLDEGTYQIFATYCSLVLHHYRVKKELQKTTRFFTIDKELLQHHWKPCNHDLDRLKNAKLVQPSDDFFSFKWYPFDEHYAKIDEYALVLYKTLLGSYFMKRNNMPKFVSIMRKSYRSSTKYHNFEHGYTVCHGVANILVRNKQVFTGIELVAMMIGSLGHDADHRAQTNSFVYLIKHPMALLYDSAILENHHFYVTNMIIKECQLFSYLSPEFYKQVIDEVEAIILHTDLALHFRGRAKLAGILAERQFKWPNPDHRFLMKGIIMTSCDLIGQSKTFRVAERLLTLLYQEFYAQGDEERKLGLNVLPMMDRDKTSQIPDDQVKFLSFVVIPCNELLYNLFPNTKEMIDNTRDLMERWKDVVDKKISWQPDDILYQKQSMIVV